jgi:chromosome segregation ATPase
MPTDIYSLGLKADSTDIKNADKDLDNLANAADKAGNEVEDFGNKSKNAGSKTKALSSNAKTANSAMGGMSRQAGQAGIQIQQLVGQIQGGTSAFTALSQQGADLGIVLGAPLVGVIASLGAVLVGTLVSALKTTKVQAEDLIPRITELREEWQALTDAQTRLIKRDIAKRQEEINETITKLTDKLAMAQQQYDGYNERLEAANENNRAGATFTNLLNERMAQQQIVMDNTTAAIDTERQALERLNNELGILNGETDRGAKDSGKPWWGGDAAVEAEAAAIRLQIFKDAQAEIDMARQDNLSGYQSILQMQFQAEQAYYQLSKDEQLLFIADMSRAYGAYADSRVQSDINAAKQREEIEKSTQQNVLAIDRSFDSIFRDLMDSQSKELFEIGKVGAASKAAFDAYGAINATLAQGGALAAPAAWAIGTAAFVNVSKILSTKYGSTGGGVGSAPSIPDPVQQGDTVQNTQTTINIAGDATQSIVDQLEELFGSDAVPIKRGTAQYRELRS